jgi:hypothetical protein
MSQNSIVAAASIRVKNLSTFLAICEKGTRDDVHGESIHFLQSHKILRNLGALPDFEIMEENNFSFPTCGRIRLDYVHNYAIQVEFLKNLLYV